MSGTISISLSNGGSFIVDEDDKELIAGYNFYSVKMGKGNNLAVMTWDRAAKKAVSLLYLLCPENKGRHTTFLNNNRFDYRRENLVTASGRIVSNGEASYILVNRGGKDYQCWISESDVELLKEINYRWGMTPSGYVFTTIKKKQIYIHRFLLNTAENEEVDHDDNNPLNNRRENLKIVSSGQNAQNRPALISVIPQREKPAFVSRAGRKNQRTMWIDGDTVKIELTQGQIATVDKGDLGLVEGITWGATWNPGGQKYYAMASKPTRYLHQVIMGTVGQGRTVHVDHIDNDGLNCRRSNLRIVTPTQNAQNKVKPNRNNKTGEKNIHLLRPTDTLQVRVVSGKKILSATFPNTPEGMELAKEKLAEFRTQLGFID